MKADITKCKDCHTPITQVSRGRSRIRCKPCARKANHERMVDAHGKYNREYRKRKKSEIISVKHGHTRVFYKFVLPFFLLPDVIEQRRVI